MAVRSLFALLKILEEPLGECLRMTDTNTTIERQFRQRSTSKCTSEHRGEANERICGLALGGEL